LTRAIVVMPSVLEGTGVTDDAEIDDGGSRQQRPLFERFDWPPTTSAEPIRPASAVQIARGLGQELTNEPSQQPKVIE